MSGPKRADVEAQLNIAKRSQRQCATLISTAAEAAIAGIMRETDEILRDSDGLARRLREGAEGITPDMRRIAPDAVRDSDGAAGRSSQLLDNVRETLKRSRTEVERARQQENRANQTFENAEREYSRAESALRNAGGHYMHDEMRWAQAATNLYEQAALELNVATKARNQAQSVASDALRMAREAQGNINGAIRQVQSTREEAQSLLRAEAEAKRIAEEKRRNATVAFEKGRSAVGRFNDLPHQKFRPGEVDKLRRELEKAANDIKADRFDSVREISERVASLAIALEREVMEAQREFERRKAESETQVGILEATLTGLDEPLIREWSVQADACGDARDVIAQARRSISEERFEDATAAARDMRQKLSDAMQSAAESKSSHEQRIHIGDAIMDVLRELKFDVSFDPGGRDEPLRISGQTPDVNGKGDFDIAIPLSGEVDFEVNIPEGDISCIGAINELQKRLAERGVKWNTTDWGHAEGAVPNGNVVTPHGPDTHGSLLHGASKS